MEASSSPDKPLPAGVGMYQRGPDDKDAKPLPEGIAESDLVDGPKIVPMRSGAALLGDSTPAAPAAAFAPLPLPAKMGVGLTAAALTAPIAPPPPPVAVTTPVIKTDYSAAVAALLLDILAAKVHALLALLAAFAIWGLVIYSPDPWRLAGAGAFSVLIVLPVMLIWWRALNRDVGG